MLDGKVALVTGGSRGIGAATARRLAADGADVALTYAASKDRADDVVAEIQALGRRAVAIQADSGSTTEVVDAVERVVAEFGRLDILVNNAGIFRAGPLSEVTVDDIDQTFAIHVRGVLLATQAAARHLPSGGRVVTIGSCFADRVPSEGLTVYAASKSALNGMTRGLARDLGPRGVTVNVIHPGNTDTEMNPADGPLAEQNRAGTVFGTHLHADDIAATVAFLAGEGGRLTTGTALTVDAGANA